MNGEVNEKVGIDERYKQVFEAHRHASDYRLKLLAGWGVVYAAFAAAFVWAQSAAKSVSWIVTALWMGLTALVWIADVRNRPAIHQSKRVGEAIEEATKVPDNQKFFSGLDKGVSHSTAIDISAIVMLLLLGVATIYLFCSRGELPK